MASRYPITRDDFSAICQEVSKAAQEHDLILLNAGSSAGLGELLVHGVAVRPGHPVIIGMIHVDRPNTQKSLGYESSALKIPIIGVPGYPVSAALTGEIFVEPLV